MATEKRLIDANALKSAMYLITHVCNTETIFIDAIVDEIDNADDVDAVEVVRCKDCKHYDNSEGIQWCHLNSKFAQWGTDWHSFPEDGFCSYGERKDNGI